MRAQAKRIRHEEEEESAFVSMTDMTVGFLFIMMILLAFFASQTRETETVPMSRFEGMVSERDEWRATAKAQEATITDLKALLEKLEKELADLLLTIERKDEEIAKKDQTISELEMEIKAQEITIAELKAQLEKLEKERDTLLLTIKRKDEEIAKKDQTISELEKEIERLQQRLKDLGIVDPLEAYLAQVTLTRTKILKQLSQAIKVNYSNLNIELIEETGRLRFQDEGWFEHDETRFKTPQITEMVQTIGKHLNAVLPCYTLGSASTFSDGCNPHEVLIEAVQIEGHTDSDGVEARNRDLSAQRANAAFFEMTSAAPTLKVHNNLNEQSVLSVAAYGPDRPIKSNETNEGKAANRRIELRFIMVTPKNSDEINAIRKALRNGIVKP